MSQAISDSTPTHSDKKQRPWYREILLNILLMSGALVFTLVLAEFVFYILNKVSPVEKAEIAEFESIPNQERLDFFQYHPVYGYAGIPNVSKYFNGKLITHNSKGLRGPEIPYAKPDGVSRIAFIGDSQTWGWSVSDAETIPQFTQRIITQELGGGPVEVLNFGATGYGVDQSYLRLISEGLHYSPDVVVLTYFSDNDIWETSSKEAWGVEKPYMYEKEDGQFCVSNVPPRRASGWPSDNIGYILENKLNLNIPTLQFSIFTVDLGNSNIARYFKHRSLSPALLALLGGEPTDPIRAIEEHVGCLEKEPGPLLTSWDEKIQLTLNIIGRIRDTAEANGARFLVVAKPLENDYQSRRNNPDYNKILNGLADRKIDVIELKTEGNLVGLDTRHMYIGSGHLSPQGNFLAARKLAEAITGKDGEPALARE